MKSTMVLTLLAFGNTQAFFVSAPLSWRTAATAATGTSSVCRAEDWAGFARRRSAGLCMATNSELDQSAEYVKAELARVQEEYEANRKAKMKEQTRQAAARGDAAVTPLADLEFHSFLDKDGKVASIDTKGVKASVYAVYDESKTLRYIGVSRGIQQSLRLSLARRPKDTYYFKVQNITRPSRSLLEIIKESWIEENGSTPDGNADEASQAVWEHAINVVPLFTEEDRAVVAEWKEKGKEDRGLKKIAGRFENEILEILEERGVKESIRFDPKLKGKGLLDVKMAKPDSSVPK
ncbi:unnamed protein product [Ectocarpus sp. 12 AP-2014]